jgi:hypothetical protein
MSSLLCPGAPTGRNELPNPGRHDVGADGRVQMKSLRHPILERVPESETHASAHHGAIWKSLRHPILERVPESETHASAHHGAIKAPFGSHSATTAPFGSHSAT